MALRCGYRRFTHFSTYMALNLFFVIQDADKFLVNYLKVFFEQFKAEAVKKSTDNARTSTAINTYFNVYSLIVIFRSQHTLDENEWSLKD